jgi:hypothetical protein
VQVLLHHTKSEDVKGCGTRMCIDIPHAPTRLHGVMLDYAQEELFNSHITQIYAVKSVTTIHKHRAGNCQQSLCYVMKKFKKN